MTRLNNYMNHHAGLYNFHSGMPQLTDNPAGAAELINEPKMQPQLMDELTQQLENNANANNFCDMSLSQAIMP